MSTTNNNSMNNENTTTAAPVIYIAQEDIRRLRPLAAALPAKTSSDGAASLLGELDRAIVLAREALPPDVVTVNTRVRFKDLASGEEEEYVIAWPERADAAAQRVSVLAPIGTALLGYQLGDEISWPTPGGVRRLEIIRVEPVPEEPVEEESSEATVARLLYGVK